MPRKTGSRRDRAERRRREREAHNAARGIVANDKGTPNQKIEEQRKRWAWLAKPTKVDGEATTVDQEVHDAIGQMFTCGLLEGHGHDPQTMRDVAREWGIGFALWYKSSGVKTASYERMDRSVNVRPMNDRELRFKRLNDALTGTEKAALMMLVVDPIVGDFVGDPIVPWARAVIDERLLTLAVEAKRRGQAYHMPEFERAPDDLEREWFAASLRGMAQLVDASLPGRYERRAA